MLGRLIKFELSLHLKQVSFWVVAIVLFLLGILIISTDVFSGGSMTGERIKANGSVAVAAQISSISLFAIFFSAIYVVIGVMRDETFSAIEMIHATPVSTKHLTLSRLTGAIAATFISLFSGVLGLFCGQFMPWIEQAILGPVNVLYYVQYTIVFLGVNTVLVCALFTAVAATTRNRTLVYVSGVGMFFIYTAVGLFTGEAGHDMVTALVDPFGIDALSQQTQYWPASEQNSRMVSLYGFVGLNRLLWGSLALLILFSTFGLFRRGLVHQESAKSGVIENKNTDKRFEKTSLNSLKHALSWRVWPALWMRTTFEYFSIVKSIAFLILIAMAVVFFVLNIYVQVAFVSDPLLPTNVLMAQTAIGSVSMSLIIIVVFFSGEMTWRESTIGINELIDCTPVQNGPLMFGKWLAMFGVILSIIVVAMVVGMVAQLVLGDVPLNLTTHLKIAFIPVVPELFFLVVLAMFVQNLMPSRILGMIGSAGLILFFSIGVKMLSIYHPLMGYASLPIHAFSEMNGFGDLLEFWWLFAYWLGLSGVFVVVSIWLWRRSSQGSFKARISGVTSRIAPVSTGLGIASVCVFALCGWVIYHGFNVKNTYQSTKHHEAELARLERLFTDEIQQAVPKIRAVNVNLQLYPSQQKATLSGSYTLENTTAKALSKILISVPYDKTALSQSISLAGASRVTSGPNIADLNAMQVRQYTFEPPLAVGARTELSFNTTIPEPELGQDSPILKNGTFINHLQVMPSVGLRDFRLQNPDRRRKHDLPELEDLKERTDRTAREYSFFDKSADYVDFSATVCTDINQIPMAPGTLLRRYTQEDRACRDYKAEQPIANFFAFVSGDFDVAEQQWQGANNKQVDLAIYYDRQHNYNIDLMMTAMKQSLETYERVFGPYQYTHLRIMEFPYRYFAQSFAGSIPFSENIGFMRDPGNLNDSDSVDLASYITMHEVAHQWFGHQIVPANTKGFNVLSEGLSEHAAITAYEEAFGWVKARRLLEKQAIEGYLSGRTVDVRDEPPLAKAGGQDYLVYNKASWVFWGLKHTIGPERMQDAIRHFVQTHGLTGAPYPTTLELVAALRDVSAPEYQQLISDYWDRITFWELSIENSKTKVIPHKDGVTLNLMVNLDKKIASKANAEETSVTAMTDEALNEWVELGFYDKDPDKTLGGDWLRLERVRLTEAVTTLSFNFEKKPKYILLDPRRLLIERNVDDNKARLD